MIARALRYRVAMMSTRVRALALAMVLGACSREAAPVERAPDVVSPADAARGKAIIGELKRSLVGALTEAMGQGVPAAIDVCHREASKLAAAVARDGATVGRATRKPRNPANLATGWQAEALTRFEQAHAAGTPLDRETFSRVLPGGRIAYAEPLVIQPLCTACHGTSLAPEVTAALAERYPDDQATGYAPGDLRGLAWVELPPARP